jgi:hypothetical protein
VVHEASNYGEAPSLHVTIGLLPRPGADLLLAAAAGRCAPIPLSLAAPAGFARFGFDRTEIHSELHG